MQRCGNPVVHLSPNRKVTDFSRQSVSNPWLVTAPLQCAINRIKPQGAHLTQPIVNHQRHLIKDVFGKRKDWRRILTRYDRRAHTFLKTIAITAIVIFWLGRQ